MKDKTNSRNDVLWMNWSVSNCGMLILSLTTGLEVKHAWYTVSICLASMWNSFSHHLLSQFCIFIFKVYLCCKHHITGSLMFRKMSIWVLIGMLNLLTIFCKQQCAQVFGFADSCMIHLFLVPLFLLTCLLLSG